MTATGTIGFIRTTINDPDLANQLNRLQNFGCQQIFSDSYKLQTNHPLPEKSLDDIINTLVEGNVLVVCDLHRLGRSTRQLTELTSWFQKNKIHLVSLEEGIDTRSPSGEIYFKMMEDLAEMEQLLIKERTLVGLNKARENGKIGGRPKIDAKTVRKIRRLYYDKKEPIQHISTKCDVSVGTCYKYINLTEDEVQKFL